MASRQRPRINSATLPAAKIHFFYNIQQANQKNYETQHLCFVSYNFLYVKNKKEVHWVVNGKLYKYNSHGIIRD